MNILHLSDIHFGRNYPYYGIKDNFSKHDKILDELINIISNLDDMLKPEHILFTGDIVWHGKSKEYKEAEIWFKKLLKACNLTGKDISFCVGNHDIDLSYTNLETNVTSNMVNEIDEMYRYENIEKLEPCLYAYNEFCKNIGTEPYIYPLKGKKKYSYSVGYKDVHFKNGKTIRLLSMNTALLMTQKNIPDDKMWLGREQIKSLMTYDILPASKDIWYTIALFHHSDRFLHPNETSTYDGRSATLPLMMNFANLLLCGHTESSGRPRINRQLGGGTMLLGGAAYYSDDHINAFSMVYISERKHTMGYIPYIYEDGWKDYDFYQQDLDIEKHKTFLDIGKCYENIKIICENDFDTFTINSKYLEIKKYKKDNTEYLHIDNSKDIMNDFQINLDCKVDELSGIKISINNKLKNVIDTMLNYKKYENFATTKSGIKNCKILSSDSEVIISFNNFICDKILDCDEKLLNDIKIIEDYYDMKFYLPKQIHKNDIERISILKNIATCGYTDKIKTESSFIIRSNYTKLLSNYNSAVKNNLFGIKEENYYTVNLFGVNVNIGKATFFTFPFYLDTKDTKYKLETFCNDDERDCLFYSGDNVKAYILKNYEKFVEENNIPDFTELKNDKDISFKLDL